MSRDASGIVGKTISGVIHKRSIDHHTYPHGQVFLLFSDNTYYEFYAYADEIRQTKGLDWGGAEEVREYMSIGMEIIFEKLLLN